MVFGFNFLRAYALMYGGACTAENCASAAAQAPAWRTGRGNSAGKQGTGSMLVAKPAGRTSCTGA